MTPRHLSILPIGHFDPCHTPRDLLDARRSSVSRGALHRCLGLHGGGWHGEAGVFCEGREGNGRVGLPPPRTANHFWETVTSYSFSRSKCGLVGDTGHPCQRTLTSKAYECDFQMKFHSLAQLFVFCPSYTCFLKANLIADAIPLCSAAYLRVRVGMTLGKAARSVVYENTKICARRNLR